MKKRWLLMIAMLLCVLWVVPGSESEAAKRPTVAKRQTVFFINQKEVGSPSYSMTAGTMANDLIFIKNMPKKGKIRNIRCSSRKIRVRRDDTVFRNTLELMLSGKVKHGERIRVSFQVISGKKRYNLSTVLVFKKYRCPYSEIKIEGKKYKSDTSGMILVDRASLKDNSARISTRARKGIKVKGMVAVYGDIGEPHIREYRSGDRVDLSDMVGLVIIYEHKKPSGYQRKLARDAGDRKAGDTALHEMVMVMFL